MRRTQGLGHAGDLGPDLEAALPAQLRQARYPLALLVDEVDHVGIAEPAQSQEERTRERPDHALHEATPTSVLRIIEVHHQPAVDVDEQHRVLPRVGDAQHPHPVGDPYPRLVGQHLDPVSVAGQIPGNTAADVIGQQDPGIAEQWQRRRVEVVRVPVGEPDCAGDPDGGVLLRRDLVRQAPTPEVGRPADPGIGGQDRLPVVHDDRGVPDRLETDLHRVAG